MNKRELSKQFKYLDDLRQSGVTNMLSAAKYVQSAFGLTLEDSRRINQMWRNTFDGKSSPEDRAKRALGPAQSGGGV